MTDSLPTKRESISTYSNLSQDLTPLINRYYGLTGAIIGTGISIEGFDFMSLRSEMDVAVTIGVNECIRFFSTDYLCLCDVQALPKVYPYIDTKKTSIVISRKTFEWCVNKNNKTKKLIAEKLSKVPEIFSINFAGSFVGNPSEFLFYSRGIATSALSLACCFGLKRCFLFGLDFYRKIHQKYAYDISPPDKVDLLTIPYEPRFYSTPPMRSMREAIEQNVNIWDGTEFINMSRFSQLKCFPIDEERSLPRKEQQ